MIRKTKPTLAKYKRYSAMTCPMGIKLDSTLNAMKNHKIPNETIRYDLYVTAARIKRQSKNTPHSAVFWST